MPAVPCGRVKLEHTLKTSLRSAVFAEVVQRVAAQSIADKCEGLIIAETGDGGKPFYDVLSSARLANIKMQGSQGPKSTQLGFPIIELFGQ